MFNKIPIRLYYGRDGKLMLKDNLQKTPMLTKLSNYAYTLRVVVPFSNEENNTLWFNYRKGDGTQNATPIPMRFEDYEVIDDETYWVYTCDIEDSVLSIASENHSNQLLISPSVHSFTITGYDDDNQAIIEDNSWLNLQPCNLVCTYALSNNETYVDDTPIEYIINYINDIVKTLVPKVSGVQVVNQLPTYDSGLRYSAYLLRADSGLFKKGDIVYTGDTGYERLVLGADSINALIEGFLTKLNGIIKVDNDSINDLGLNEYAIATEDITYGEEETIPLGTIFYIADDLVHIVAFGKSKVLDLIDGVESEISGLNDTIETMQGDIDTINENIETINTNIDNIETDMDTIQDEIDTIDNDINNTTNGIKTKIATIETDIANIETNIDDVESDITDINNDITSVKGDIEDLDDDLTTQKGRITTNENDIASLESDNATLHNDISTINSTLPAKLNKDLSDISNANQIADTDILVIKSGATTYKITFLQLRNAIGNIEVNHYKGDFASYQALVQAYPTAEPGDYAFVVVSGNLVMYVWDDASDSWKQTSTDQYVQSAVFDSYKTDIANGTIIVGKASDYNTSSGGIKTKFDSVDTSIANIISGTQEVAKATQAQNYDTNNGTIKTKFDSLESEFDNYYDKDTIDSLGEQLQAQIESVQGDVEDIQGDITTIQGDISDLDSSKQDNLSVNQPNPTSSLSSLTISGVNYSIATQIPITSTQVQLEESD